MKVPQNLRLDRKTQDLGRKSREWQRCGHSGASMSLIPGAVIDSDHGLVMGNTKIKLKKRRVGQHREHRGFTRLGESLLIGDRSETDSNKIYKED